MNPEQLLLQLGLAGAILFVVYKLGMKWLDKWSEGEKAKNTVLANGFAAITTSVNDHSARDVASHERLAEAHSKLREQIAADHSRMEGKLDAALELTPGPQTPPRRATPAQGVATGFYSHTRKGGG